MGATLALAVLTTSYPRWEGDDAGIFVERMVRGVSLTGLSGYVIVPDDSGEGRAPLGETGSFHVVRFSYSGRKKRLAFGAGILPNVKADPTLLLQLPRMLLGFLITLFQHRHTINLVHANWSLTALPAAMYSLARGTPFIVTLRGEDVRLLKIGILRVVTKLALRRAKTLVSVNESFLSEIQKAVGPGGPPVVYIPNGVEVRDVSEDEASEFRMERSLPAQSPIFLYIGRVIPLKNIEFLLSVMHLIAPTDALLILAGRPSSELYLKQLEEKCAALGIVERVRFVGQVSPDEIPLYLSVATIYLSASTREGRPNSVLEALAVGKIVLVSDIPAHREIISDRKNGFLFNLAEPHGCAQRIKEILEPSSEGFNEELEKVRRAARESASYYSWSKCAMSYHTLYQEALK